MFPMGAIFNEEIFHPAEVNCSSAAVLPQDTTHLLQRPRYQRTTPRPPDHRKDTETAVVWSCLPFIRSGQNQLARHSESGKKTRQTEEEVGR